MRRFLTLVLAALLIPLGFFGWGYHNARADPIVRQTTVALPDWPAGAAPVRVALLSDIHIGSAAMDSGRLHRIVAQVMALHPDLILIPGDFIDGHDWNQAAPLARALIAPLAGLHAPLGVLATLGNHDEDVGPDKVRRALERAGITVLDNSAVARGPLAIGGAGDAYTGHARLDATLAAMAPLAGARIMVSHSPDLAPTLPGDVSLLLAGHTHCGQVLLPLVPKPNFSRFGDRYRCGIVREGARTVIVTGGVGTSQLPLRYGAPADLWLITLGPPPVSRSRS